MNLVLIRCAGPSPWQTSSTVRRRVSLHVGLLAPLVCAFGVPRWASMTEQHGLLFGVRALTTQRPCNESTMTCYNLDRRPPALSAISWQHGCQFDVPGHIQPPLCPVPFPHYFLFGLSFMF